MCVGDLAEVVEVDAGDAVARVTVGTTERVVSLALHPDTRPGDRVVVHTGFVVEVLDDGIDETTARTDRRRP